MRIIISPAKKMRVETDILAWRDLPVFLPQTRRLLSRLREMSYEELRALWRCNDRIAALNAERLREMELTRRLTPAILAYEGIQYQYMGPEAFTDQELAYLQEHLRILSGFYGVLRPLDGVAPYRLEMQAGLETDGAKNLYVFWGGLIAQRLFEETDLLINLASKEYSVCASKYLPTGARLITCVFGEEKDGKVIEKGTLCKMARGEMVRYMAENRITSPEEIQAFSRLHFRYCARLSKADTYVFLKDGTRPEC